MPKHSASKGGHGPTKVLVYYTDGHISTVGLTKRHGVYQSGQVEFKHDGAEITHYDAVCKHGHVFVSCNGPVSCPYPNCPCTGGQFSFRL